MSIVEEILGTEVKDVTGKLVYGLKRSLSECERPSKDFMNLLLSFLRKGNFGTVSCENDDSLLSEIVKSLLHALKIDKKDETDSAFYLISKCIAFCMKSSRNCNEILNSFLLRNIQKYVREGKENDFSLCEEDEDELIGKCQQGNKIISSILYLLLELGKDICIYFDEKEDENSLGTLKPEIFESLLQVMIVDADETILAVLAHIIKMYLNQPEPKKKEIFQKLYEAWWQKSENNVFYGVACLIIDMLLCGDEYDIRNEAKLRWFIQNGLTSDDVLTRKRSMYLLKKIAGINHIDKTFKQWSNLADFILLFETLEEKQLHVILPVLPMVSSILEISSYESFRESALHFSWVSTIFIRAFHHDNRFITRWAIDGILDLEVSKFNFFQTENLQYLIDPLFCALKEYYLFEKDPGLDDSKPPSIVTKLSDFFLRCQNAASVNQQIEFFRKIIASLCSNGYNTVAFPYIAEAISPLILPDVVNGKLLSLIKTWMITETSTFPTELKTASFHLLLRIVMNCLSKDDITLVNFVQLLKVTFEQGCLTFGSDLWCLITTAMGDGIFSWKLQHGSDQTITSLENLKLLCVESVSKFLQGGSEIFELTEEVCLLIFITIEIMKESGRQVGINFIEPIMDLIFDTLTKFGRSPYICEEKVERSLSMISFLLNGCIGATENQQESDMTNLIHEKLLERSKTIVSMHRNILENAFGEDAISSDLMRLCLAVTLSVCNQFKNTSHSDLVLEHMASVLKICSIYMKDIDENRNSRSIYLIFKSLEMVSKMVDGKLHEHGACRNMQLERSLLDVIQVLNLDFTVFFPSRHLSNQKGSEDASFFAGNIISAVWTLVSVALKKEETLTALKGRSFSEKVDNHKVALTLMTCTITDLVAKILEAIDVSVGNDMIPLLHCLDLLMPDIVTSSKSLAILVLESVWRMCLEQERRDSRFWPLFVPCVNVLFQKSVLLSFDKEIHDKVTEFWRFLEDVGKKKSGVFNVVVSHCCAIWKGWLLSNKSIEEDHEESMLWCIDLLVDACTFGLVQKKASRIMQQIIKHFNAKFFSGREVSKNVNIDYQVRWNVTNMLSKIDGNSRQSSIVDKVMKRLIENDKRLSMKVKRYYDNSITHRQKLRTWQTMLILGKFVKKENACDVISQALTVMISENQPSIRYYIEWFVVIVINKIPSLISVIWRNLSEASERRICSVTCLMSIIIHVAVILPDREFSEMAAEAFNKVLPWVQVHHLQARVHAQIVIWKIWEELKRRKCDDVLKEYRLIESLFALNETNASVFKAREEIKNHFYFKIFHPIEHHSLETIYCSMPKLLNIGEDEILSGNKLIEMVERGETRYGIELYNKGASLFDLVMKASNGCDVSESKTGDRRGHMQNNTTEKEISKGTTSDVQKKIVAWKPLPPTEDPFLQKADIYKKEFQRSNLVLCASLIDRTPNLGGLCRTCEIFGVSTLVIGAMRYLDDSNFKSLSVTSEKWINIEQVLARHLETYLKEMKGKGYRLVGIEQTANSRSLEEYNFQEKTLLLLGNEREGIPVELIHILDDCVEIPQQGVIRSLNVHVSGALVTWEYCKQRLLGQHKEA